MKQRRLRRSRELTRRGVATRLQVAIATVRRWEGTLLHPRIKPNGVRVFDPTEVDRLARSRKGEKKDDEGELAARALELLRGGADLGEVVIALRRPLEWVRRYYAVHCGDGAQLILSVEHRRTLETAIGRKLTPEDLVRTVLRLRSKSANGHEELR